ncbi:heme-binding protein [Streptomyces sp. NPDC058914]|uniref:heme-binding protein n=1 Tax=Streptomyces sp. NPDC058914 TaxID=3346671 RepID=UPI0036B5EF65
MSSRLRYRLHLGDGAGLLRPDIAVAEAGGVLGPGIDNRRIGRRDAAAPEFFTSIAALAGGRVPSVPGGVSVRDEQGHVPGAVGVTGGTSLDDERAAVAGIRAGGLVAATGAEEQAEQTHAARSAACAAGPRPPAGP